MQYTSKDNRSTKLDKTDDIIWFDTPNTNTRLLSVCLSVRLSVCLSVWLSVLNEQPPGFASYEQNTRPKRSANWGNLSLQLVYLPGVPFVEYPIYGIWIYP